MNLKELPYAKEYPSFFPSLHKQKSLEIFKELTTSPALILCLLRLPQACPLLPYTNTKKTTRP